MALADIDRSRAVWWSVGGALAAVVAFVVYSFVGTFVFAAFIYYATRPVYERLRRRMLPSLAAAVALLALALPVILLLSYTVAIALQEFSRFSARTGDLGPLDRALGPYLDVSAIVEDPTSILSDPSFAENVGAVLDSALTYAGFIGTGLLHLFVMFALAFYLLRDGPRLARWFTGRFADDAGVLRAYLSAVDADLYKIFSGNIFNAIFTGIIGAIAFSVIDFFAPGSGIPYPALLGLLAGAASLVPVVGMKLVYVPVAGYLFFAQYASATPHYWVPTAFAAISFVIVDTIPDLVLRPYVSGRSLHVGSVMFAYIFGPLLFGWYGIFLGPILLVLVVHFVRLVLPELVSGTPIRPFAVDPGVLPESVVEGGTPTGAAGSEEPGRASAGSEQPGGASAGSEQPGGASAGSEEQGDPTDGSDEHRGGAPGPEE